jgi:hypothetical protein
MWIIFIRESSLACMAYRFTPFVRQGEIVEDLHLNHLWLMIISRCFCRILFIFPEDTKTLSPLTQCFCYRLLSSLEFSERTCTSWRRNFALIMIRRVFLWHLWLLFICYLNNNMIRYPLFGVQTESMICSDLENFMISDYRFRFSGRFANIFG